MNRFVVLRLLALMLATCTVGAASVAAARPALAADCQTVGQVYVSGVGDLNVKYETDPINGSYFAYAASPPRAFVILGGNGLMPGSKPSWDVYSGNNGGFVGTLEGSTTSSNCVSDQKTYPLYGNTGDSYQIRANYVAGNSGNVISQQNHFMVTFNL